MKYCFLGALLLLSLNAVVCRKSREIRIVSANTKYYDELVNWMIGQQLNQRLNRKFSFWWFVCFFFFAVIAHNNSGFDRPQFGFGIEKLPTTIPLGSMELSDGRFPCETLFDAIGSWDGLCSDAHNGRTNLYGGEKLFAPRNQGMRMQ